MGTWNPWRGCHRFSEGCKFCYIHKGDAKRGVDTENITRTDSFYAPAAKKKNGEYKMRSGDLVYVCFSTDFLIEEADPWRNECWKIIKEREDLHFLFLTKRIERFMDCIPEDWGDGYDNVTVGCTVEDQNSADRRLTIFEELPIKHKNIIAQPLIGPVDMSAYLKDVELVVVGGEQDKNARPLDHVWVLDIREQCQRASVKFQFRQCGTHYIKDGIVTTVPTRLLCSVARKADIDL
ncbi:MAG: phage Gp37/Gp68 family protein [Methanomassiliicoccaceae archaeon]|jgi:protein gp37|nr:phage Gp37/Gp68 family protein [Methanomassiliicoccaceae archaeon]